MPLEIGRILSRLIAENKISSPDSPKGRLLAAAAKLCCEKGYASTTVREFQKTYHKMVLLGLNEVQLDPLWF